MKNAPKLPTARYRSPVRAARSEATRARIRAAAAALLSEGDGAAGSVTFKAVAARAGVTEMTVYRHFPTREALLKGLWEHLNARMGDEIGMPADRAALNAQHAALFSGFDRIAPQILASLTTPEGRAMRAALNDERRAAFLGLVDAAAPGTTPARRRQAAAVIQLLHSAHAWLSLREQWDMDGREAARATRWAIDTLIDSLRRTP